MMDKFNIVKHKGKPYLMIRLSESDIDKLEGKIDSYKTIIYAKPYNINIYD